MIRKAQQMGLGMLGLALGCGSNTTPPELSLVACGSSAQVQPQVTQLSIAPCSEAGSAAQGRLVRVQVPERKGNVLRIRVNGGEAHWADSSDAPAQLLCARLDTKLDRQLLVAVDSKAGTAVIAAVVVDGAWASDRSTIDEATCNELQPAEASRSLVVSASPPTDTATAKPTDTATAKPTDTATAKPTDTATAKPTDTATAKPTDTATAKPTDTATAKPAGTATAKPTDTATAKPTVNRSSPSPARK